VDKGNVVGKKSCNILSTWHKSVSQGRRGFLFLHNFYCISSAKWNFSHNYMWRFQGNFQPLSWLFTFSETRFYSLLKRLIDQKRPFFLEWKKNLFFLGSNVASNNFLRHSNSKTSLYRRNKTFFEQILVKFITVLLGKKNFKKCSLFNQSIHFRVSIYKNARKGFEQGSLMLANETRLNL
jgi:hypothetical protein